MECKHPRPSRRDYLLAKALTSFFIAYLFLRGFAGVDEDSRSLTLLKSWYYVGPFIGFSLVSAYFGTAVLVPAFRDRAINLAREFSPALGIATLVGFTLGWIAGFGELKPIGVLSSVYFWTGFAWVVALFADTLWAAWRAESTLRATDVPRPKAYSGGDSRPTS